MKSGLLTLCLQSVSPDNRKLDIGKDKTADQNENLGPDD